jgi:hypothetical protein
MNITLGDFAAISSICAGSAAVLFWAVRGKLGAEFVTNTEYAEAQKRLQAIEARLELVPTHEDFKAVNANVAGVALQVATMTERVDGVKGSLARIESTLRAFVDARLQWEKDR